MTKKMCLIMRRNVHPTERGGGGGAKLGQILTG